jgi:SAM-dependent methyltransferase
MAALAPREGERLADIGCGCGATTLELARRVGSGGGVLGVDISAPMLAVARERAKAAGLDQAHFIQADAQIYAFEPADGAFSRFGVMFFAEPVVSFANLRRALRPSGRVVFACWREPRENPWMMAPLQAIYQHVPKLPPQGPEDPGPFAFASAERVRRILNDAGYKGIEMERVALAFDIANGGGLDVAVQAAMQIGPGSRALAGHTPETREAAAKSIKELLAPYVRGQSVTLAGSIWIVTARAS